MEGRSKGRSEGRSDNRTNRSRLYRQDTRSNNVTQQTHKGLGILEGRTEGRSEDGSEGRLNNRGTSQGCAYRIR